MIASKINAIRLDGIITILAARGLFDDFFE
jgi:hypothetical protein